MNKLLLFFLFTFYITIVNAQKAASTNSPVKDTSVFYIRAVNNNEILVKTIDSADYSRVILPPDTSVDKTLDRINDFYKNGRKKMIGNAVIINHQLLLSGPCMEFYENGKRKSIKTYIKGVTLGNFSLYYPNGKPYIMGQIDEKGNTTVQEARDSTGNVTATNGSGRLTRYTADFKRIVEAGPIANGVEEGEWRSTSKDSSITLVCNYKNGIYQNGTSFDKKGLKMPSNVLFQEPAFPGGIPAFRFFLGRTIKYPIAALEKNIQGKVYLSFVVEPDGSLTDIRVTKSVWRDIDQEAMRVMKLSPKWTPGTLNGMPVRVAYTLPLSFTMTNDN